MAGTPAVVATSAVAAISSPPFDVAGEMAGWEP